MDRPRRDRDHVSGPELSHLTIHQELDLAIHHSRYLVMGLMEVGLHPTSGREVGDDSAASFGVVDPGTTGGLALLDRVLIPHLE